MDCNANNHRFGLCSKHQLFDSEPGTKPKQYELPLDCLYLQQRGMVCHVQAAHFGGHDMVVLCTVHGGDRGWKFDRSPNLTGHRAPDRSKS